jgi:hypothetical protein
MNKYFIYAIIIFALILVIGAITYGARLLNNAATPITVTEVEKGVKCASMVTKDGAALSCWKM